MATEEEIADILCLMKASFPNAKFGTDTLKVYNLFLADIDAGLLQAAALDYISKAVFFPKPSELRQTVADLLLEAEGIPTGAEAWGKVTEEIHRVGHWGKPNLSPMTLSAIEANGGWEHFCLSENNISDRKRFIDAFNILRSRKARDLTELPAVREAKKSLAEGKLKVDTAIAGLLNSMTPTHP